MDNIKNFAYGKVAVAPGPSDSGGTLTLEAGQGADFPVPPFNATMWPPNTLPRASNAEIGRCTAVSGDTLTITRAQSGTTAKHITVGYQIAQSIDVDLLGQIQDSAYPSFNIKASGADDSAVVNVAIGLMNTAGGGTLTMTGSMYRLTSAPPIPFTVPVTVILGMGSAGFGTRINCAAGISGFTFAAGAVGSTMKGGYLKSASTVAGTDNGITIRAQYVHLEKIWCDGFGQDSFNWDSTSGGNTDGCTDVGCFSLNPKRHGFYRKAGTDTNIHTSIGAGAVGAGGYNHWCNGAANKFIKQYAASGTTGDYYENGNSNFYDHPYSESGHNFDVDTGSAYATIICGAFGAPHIQAVGGGALTGTPKVSLTAYKSAPGGEGPAYVDHIMVQALDGATDNTVYGLRTGVLGPGVLEFANFTDAVELFTFDPVTGQLTFHVPVSFISNIINNPWIAATLASPWTNIAFEAAASYRLTSDGTHVEFAGHPTTGTASTTMFTLPVGLRPLTLKRLAAPNVASGYSQFIIVNTNGTVVADSLSTDYGLDGLSFPLDI